MQAQWIVPSICITRSTGINMLMMISVYCVYLFGMNALEYSAWMRHGNTFGYRVSSICPPSSSPAEAIYYNTYHSIPEKFDPRTRILTVLSTHADHWRPLDKLRSDKLEVLILKDSVTRLQIDTPNLRSFTVVNTGELVWRPSYFNFPKLRVLNFIVVYFTNPFNITALGSKELEVLRVIKTDHTKINFLYTAEFSKLRILQVGHVGSSKYFNLCKFISNLTMLEQLYTSGLDLNCIVSAERAVHGLRRLRVLHSVGTSTPVPGGRFCDLFPARIEHLHVSFAGEENDTSADCYKHLKSFGIYTTPNNYMPLPNTTTSLYLTGSRNKDSCLFGDLERVRGLIVLKTQGLYRFCKRLPRLPTVEILLFPGNEFQFHPDVDYFPELGNVRVLDLSYNPITYIPEGAFEKLSKLSVVALLRTPVSGFYDTVFCNLKWPRVLTLPYLPINVRLKQPSTLVGNHSSLSCLINSNKVSNIIFEKMTCDCAKAEYSYLTKEEQDRSVALVEIDCHIQMGMFAFDFYNESCPPVKPTSQQFVVYESRKFTAIHIIFWICLVALCWIPPLWFYCRHRRELRRQIVDNQRNNPAEYLFVICPRHARTWCKNIILPCLEADLFVHQAPHLRRVKLTAKPKIEKPLEGGQHEDIYPNIQTDNVSNQGLVHTPRNSEDYSHESDVADVETTPNGPWAWNPRFTCYLAPPARHRLQMMVKSTRVVILFPSSSLFSEPACRAQLRLAFHLYRLKRIPPPTIIVWPTEKRTTRIPRNYRSVNRNTRLPYHDKYFPAIEFNLATNDPYDIAETANIKAKVPTPEEAAKIIQYFATTTSPCIEWSNSKTALENLRPLIWLLNNTSRIPPY
ncbi:hypothetical protein PHET_04075 [Paragonimus heterotremus]|uniref:TIR domain-containing protein n=1 Tax=Paragonimus heterotremus TaxID=100268 RepID=A0A8J4WRT3_9TREM|nr:hypothetical protein PHET_04075 [Paragonimus heterotremus]